MKAIRIVTLISVFVLQTVCLSQNIIQNGDFENDFTGWVPVDSVDISSSIVHSGAKSLLVSDTAKVQFSYVHQQLALDYDRHEINFWVYPASATYFSAFELIANWQSGTADFITRVLFGDNTLSFTALDTSATISNILTPNSWNKVTIQVDKASLKQDFFINDNLVSSLTSSSLPTIENLLVGDLSALSMFGTLYFDDISITDSPTTDIAEPTTIPSEFMLQQNFPNPFNPSTQIFYSLSKATGVELTIHNVAGQTVRTLVNEFQTAGPKSIVWNGLDDRSTAVTSGLYFFQLRAGVFQETKKMILIR
ncbi:MAG: FlgD immunoglobulin-like domain containing protein [bacterium]